VIYIFVKKDVCMPKISEGFSERFCFE